MSELVIPNKGNWLYGTECGVPGGIEQYATRTEVPVVGLDTTGVTNSTPAVQAAVNAATSGQAVKLPSGTLRFNTGIDLTNRHGVTLRGTTGSGAEPLTKINFYGYGAAAACGGNPTFDFIHTTVVGSPLKGATTITLAEGNFGTPEGLQHLCQITIDDDPSIPDLSVFGFPRTNQFLVKVTSTYGPGNTIVDIDPPLPFDLPNYLNPTFAVKVGRTDNVGIEDLSIEAINVPEDSGSAVVSLGLAFGSWIKNVWVENVPNYHFNMGAAVRSDMCHCLASRRSYGRDGMPSGAGLLIGGANANAIYDNTFDRCFPGIEQNGATPSNFYSHNFFTGLALSDTIHSQILASHSTQTKYGLWEGNCGPGWSSDNYFHSLSHQTLFRNWFHATCDITVDARGNAVSNSGDLSGVCVKVNRMTRFTNIIGNILGRPSPQPGLAFPTYLFDNEDGGTSSQRYIYNFGLPNLGNGFFDGHCTPSIPGEGWKERQGPNWGGTDCSVYELGDRYIRRGDYNPDTVYNHTVDGQRDVVNYIGHLFRNTTILAWCTREPGSRVRDTPGELSNDWAPISPSGFQNLDRDVLLSSNLKANYDHATNGIPPEQSIGSDTLPDSLCFPAKPAWFGSLDWPPFDPSAPGDLTGTDAYQRLPAGYRYFQDAEVPTDTVTATPVFTPAAGAFTTAQSVAITCATPGAEIYYTTDGSEPTSADTLYTVPVDIATTTTLKAIAIDPTTTLDDSLVRTGEYVITPGEVFPVLFSPPPGTYTTSVSVVLETETAGASIYYTLDGSTPSVSSTEYTAPIEVTTTKTIRAIAVKEGVIFSVVTSGAYPIRCSSPLFLPTPSSPSSPQGQSVTAAFVTITTATPGATIRYTTDGTTPNASSPVYTETLTITVTTTLKAIALKSGCIDSPVADATYTIRCATPTFSPTPGTYPIVQNVSLVTTTPGATIKFTLDGTEPSQSSLTYSGPIAVAATLTIKAKAFKPGVTDSPTASGGYAITVVPDEPGPITGPLSGKSVTVNIMLSI
jgi:hypothetical protein